MEKDIEIESGKCVVLAFELDCDCKIVKDKKMMIKEVRSWLPHLLADRVRCGVFWKA